MATTTSNLGLVKPTDAEYALITDLNANSDKIDAEVGKERSNFALVQNGDTATQAISKDQLVVWKGVLKKATANIANGATLSGSNLSDDTIAAELTALNSKITSLDTITTYTLSTTNVNPNLSFTSGYSKLTKYAKVVTFGFRITVSSQIAGWSDLFTITNEGTIPAKDQYFPISQSLTAAITTTGKVQLLAEALPAGSYAAFVVYFVGD